MSIALTQDMLSKLRELSAKFKNGLASPADIRELSRLLERIHA